MKIVQLVYTLASGGAERFVVNLSNELVRQGHDVTVCMLRDSHIDRFLFYRPLMSDKVKFHAMDFKMGMSLSMMRKTVKYVKSINPDLIHCHLNTLPFIFPLLWSKKYKIVHTIHSLAEKDCKSKLQFYLNRRLYSSGRVRAVAISKICADSFVKFYGNDKVKTIVNGSPRAITTSALDDVRKEIAAMGTGKVFIHVSKYYPLKNQKMLIEAFNKLASDDIDFRLVVVGNFYEDPEKGLFLKEMACDKIHFVGMKLNVGDYLACSDAFCLTSRYEGLPISLLEAMSMGVVPICTAVGGIPDVVTEGVTGFLSDDNDLDSYVAAVRRFLENPLDRTVIIAQYDKHYSMEECCNSYMQLYVES